MSTQTLMLILAVSGINLFALLAIVWKGGVALGGLSTNQQQVLKALESITLRVDEHSELIAGAVATLDALQGRMDRFEGVVPRKQAIS